MVERFVQELSRAITQDMAEIRETELDNVGSYRSATLKFVDSSLDAKCDVLVDRLGRVVVPGSGMWARLDNVCFDGEEPRAVLKKEPRYEGDKVVAFVVYLESL